jgi:hypothetical protein
MSGSPGHWLLQKARYVRGIASLPLFAGGNLGTADISAALKCQFVCEMLAAMLSSVVF